MLDTIPALPDAVKPDVAPTVNEGIKSAETLNSEDKTSGTEQQETAQEDKKQDPPKQEDKDKDEKELTPAQLARKERNKQRWIQMKQRVAWAEAELARERNRKQPDLAQIDDPDEALATKTAIKVREMASVEKAEAVAILREHERAEMFETWNSIKAEMRERAPDFDQVVNDGTPIHERAAPIIVNSDKAGELAYYLGKNPDVAQDLYYKFDTNPALASYELGKIEARLSSSPPKTVTKAPKPVQTLGGNSNPPSFDQNTGSVEDFAAALKKAGVIR